MNITEHVGQAWEDDLELEQMAQFKAEIERAERMVAMPKVDRIAATEEWIARMTDAYRGESISLKDDGSPEHDD